MSCKLIFVLVILIWSLACAVGRNTSRSDATATPLAPAFNIKITDLKDIRICDLTFSQPLPKPSVVDQILWEETEKAVKQNPKKDILAKAWIGNDELSRNQYSGGLVYKALSKKIMTLAEYEKGQR